MIIGLTGTMGAGKGEVASYLKEKGFEHHTYSEIIIEETEKRGLDATRENLQKVGNLLREEHGDEGILSRKILEKIKTDKAVADGVRNSAEIRELRKAKDFYLIGVDAPQKLRFNRLKKRGRAGDPDSFEEFKRLDDKENLGRKGQEISKCLKMADFMIINDGSLTELRKKVDNLLKNITC